MSRVRVGQLVAVMALALVAGLGGGPSVPAAATLPTPVVPGTTAKRPPPPVDKSGLSDPRLQNVVDRVLTHRPVASGRAIVTGGRVRVEVVGATGPAATRAVRSVGGTTVGPRGGTVALADVPAGRLQTLEDAPGVDFVRLPLDVSEPDAVQPSAGSSLSSSQPGRQDFAAKTGPHGLEAVQKTGIGAWHAAGFTGAGVKVGIIDSFNSTVWQAAAAAGDVPATPAGQFCRATGADCAASFWNSSSPHGTAVAEIVTDMAPGAALYLASVTTVGDMMQAVDYFHSQGVRIISRSETSRYDGPGNGTGPTASVMAYAVSQGMSWFNAAGNAAGTLSSGGTRPGAYFRQEFQDLNLNQWMEFPGSAFPEYLEFSCGGGLLNGLRWSDWGAARTDYDLYVYEEPSDATLISSARADQAAGADPIESFPALGCTKGTDNDYLSVYEFAPGAGTVGDVMEFMTNDYRVEKASTPYSASGPASDTAAPGTASVGAVDPWNGAAIAAYSSQGPTNDGRLKPDLSAVSGVTSTSYPTTGFSGTSAATPVVAGAAAVLLSAAPTATPVQLVDALKASVVDRGTPGPDNVFGTGELTLPPPPAPPPPPPPPVATVSITSAVVAPILRKLKGTFPVQVRWKVSGTQASATVWRALNGGDFTQGAAVGSARKVRTKMVLDKANTYALRAVDPAGTPSAWKYTRAYKPRVIDDKDRKVKYSRSWRHFRQSGAWRHTLSSSGGASGSARLRFKGSSVSLVVFRSANSGKVKVYLDGRAVGKLNLRSNHVQARRVVANFTYATRGRHVIELQPLNTGPKAQVFLDGFLVLG